MKIVRLVLIGMMASSPILFGCDVNKNAKDTDTGNEHALTVLNPHYEIGTHKGGAPDSIINVRFNLANNTDSVIIIDKAEPGCSCVSIDGFPRKIEPNSEETLDATINIARQRNHISKAIYITYNGTKVRVVRIIGDVVE